MAVLREMAMSQVRFVERQEFARRYTQAWCSQDPTAVAAFYAAEGSLTINDGAPAVGRARIAESARSFMAAFPDLTVEMNELVDLGGDRAIFHWTLHGHNIGTGGTGNPVRITGFEEWQFGADGLVLHSLGHYDSAEYDRQISGRGERSAG